MKSTIIIIGPISAGKSTVAALVAARLNIPRYSLDALRDGYYEEIGYDRNVARSAYEQEGLFGLYK